jgi:hypothetical protein
MVSVVAIARGDDYTFGVLHSRIHEAWARGMGTQLREVESGFRYTPTTCFETFLFPRPSDAQRDAIAEAARELDRLRNGWLNPPGLSDADLARRTLTSLYNARPTWLAQARTSASTPPSSPPTAGLRISIAKTCSPGFSPSTCCGPAQLRSGRRDPEPHTMSASITTTYRLR